MSSAEIALSIFFFAVPTVLIGAAILGSRLSPPVRWRVETYFLIPSLSLATAVVAALEASARSWLAAAAFAGLCVVALASLVKRLREARRAPQSP